MRYFWLILLTTFYSFSGHCQSPCVSANEITIVVLGSSTAAGTGPSSPDSTWVNRYRNYIQSLNPSSDVINLAVGGYNTYRIMPSSFTPPPGRPTPDLARNITAALDYSPDAIIVNMPSNDVALGYSYSEQMNNLLEIRDSSAFENVPIWICTTQPRNFSDSATRQLQFDLKDSITTIFAPHTIDFWTNIADANNYIIPSLDSGDGVHLNDSAHGILSNRVINTSIPDSLVIIAPTTDYTILEVTNLTNTVCGDSLAQFQIIYANVGANATLSNSIEWSLNESSLGMIDSGASSGSSLLNCTSDTITLNLNTFNAGEYELLVWSNSPEDGNPSNDSTLISFTTIGHPGMSVSNDTLCAQGNAQLSVVVNPQDTVLWYESISSLTPFHGGSILDLGPLSADSTVYAQAIRGNLYFSDSLKTLDDGGINWNGAMFDIVASEDLVIDSIDVFVESIGTQQMNVYAKQGSHLGFETNATAWTASTSFSTNVMSAGQQISIPVSMSVNSGDTLGIYVEMDNPSSDLRYTWVSSPQTRSTNELEIITGSGSSYNFGGNYYPRDINCQIHYHFGERLEGDCATPRIPVTAFVNDIVIDLGNDTIIDILDSFVLEAPQEITNPTWSTGATTSSITVTGQALGNGIHYISVNGLDSLGCYHEDSIVVAVADLVSIEQLDLDLNLYPNPTSGIVFGLPTTPVNYEIYDSFGRKVFEQVTSKGHIDFSHLSPGIYQIRIPELSEKTYRVFKTN